MLSLLLGQLGLVLSHDFPEIVQEVALLLQALVHFLELDAHLRKLSLRLTHTIVSGIPLQISLVVIFHLCPHSLHCLELFREAELLTQFFIEHDV